MYGIIISGQLEGLDKTINARRSLSILSELLALVKFNASVTPVDGMCNSIPELSYFIEIKEDATTEDVDRIGMGIQDLAVKYKQDCIACLMDDEIVFKRVRADGVHVKGDIAQYELIKTTTPEWYTDWVCIRDEYYVSADPVQLEPEFEALDDLAHVDQIVLFM